MDDIVIVSAARTPVGSFSGALGTLSAHELGTVALRAAFERAGVEAGDVDEVILGQVLAAGEGPESRPPGRARRRVARCQDRVRHQPGVRLRPARGGARRTADPHRRKCHRGRRRHGEHEHLAALGVSARGAEDGRRRVHRHDAEGRPVGRVPRLPHGQHGGERRQQVPDHPRAAGSVRARLAAEGQCGAEGRPVQGRDRAGDGQDPQRRRGGGRRRIHPPRRQHRDDGASCGRRSARTAR